MKNKLFEQFIVKFIKKYNKNVFENISKSKSLMLDFAKGEFKNEIRLFFQILDLGCYNSILSSDDLNITRITLIKQLQEEYFINEDISSSMIDLLLLELKNFKSKNTNTEINNQNILQPIILKPSKPISKTNTLLHGTYTEKLNTGGELKISKSGWFIDYYFSGPDLRYNGTFVRIDSKQIDNYILAWQENYKQYLELKKTVPKNGEFVTPGKMDMSIRIGKFAEGVCLKSYHMPINSKNKIDAIILDYQYAKKRANELLN